MTVVEQKVDEIRAILAGQPLVAIHERERLGQARLKLGELQLYLAEIPPNERPVSVGAVQKIVSAIDTPGSQHMVYEMLRDFPGSPPTAVQREIVPVGQAAGRETAPGPTYVGKVLTGVMTGVLVGVATVLVLRRIPGMRGA